MRPNVIAGIVLLGLGAFVLLRGARLFSRQDVLRVGDVSVTANEQRSIPPWMGGAAMVLGVAVIVAGTRRPV